MQEFSPSSEDEKKHHYKHDLAEPAYYSGIMGTFALFPRTGSYQLRSPSVASRAIAFRLLLQPSRRYRAVSPLEIEEVWTGASLLKTAVLNLPTPAVRRHASYQKPIDQCCGHESPFPANLLGRDSSFSGEGVQSTFANPEELRCLIQCQNVSKLPQMATPIVHGRHLTVTKAKCQYQCGPRSSLPSR